MMRSNSIAIVILLLFSCSGKPKAEIKERSTETKVKTNSQMRPSSKVKAVEQKKSKYHSVAIFDSQIGWGYDVFEGGKLVIHQPNIPVVQGMSGFKTEDDALKVADAVILKLDQGMMPPTLTLEEMQNLGVL